MAIQATDRQVIEAWTGPINDEAGTEELLRILGSAYAVALQVLMTRRAGFEQAPARRASGGDSLDVSANLKAVNERIAQLVSAIRGNDDIDLTDEAAALVDSAQGSKPDSTRTIGVTAGNRRRGG